MLELMEKSISSRGRVGLKTGKCQKETTCWEHRTNKPAVGYVLCFWGKSVQIHTHISLRCERISRDKGRRVAEEGGEGGTDCGIEAVRKGEEVWSESRGTPDCCYPTQSPSAGAVRLTAAAAAGGGGCQTHTYGQNSCSLSPLHTHMYSHGHVTIVTRWP